MMCVSTRKARAIRAFLLRRIDGHQQSMMRWALATRGLHAHRPVPRAGWEIHGPLGTGAHR